MKFEFYDQKLGFIFGLTDDIKKDAQRFTITSGTIKDRCKV